VAIGVLLLLVLLLAVGLAFAVTHLMAANVRLEEFAAIRNIEKHKQSLERDMREAERTTSELKARATEHETRIAALQQQVAPLEYALDLRRLTAQLKASAVEEERKIAELKQELDSVEEALDIQSFGLYRPRFALARSTDYQARLEAERERQKELIKGDKAAHCPKEWMVDGSVAKGKKMIAEHMKLMLRAFNGECDAAVAKVKYNNVVMLETRVKKSFDAINKLGQAKQISITQEYQASKLDELHLVHELQEKVQAEREEQRAAKEQMRDEDRAQREIEEAQSKAEREAAVREEALEKARRELAEATGKQHDKLEQLVTKLELRPVEPGRPIPRERGPFRLKRSGARARPYEDTPIESSDRRGSRARGRAFGTTQEGDDHVPRPLRHGLDGVWKPVVAGEGDGEAAIGSDREVEAGEAERPSAEVRGRAQVDEDADVSGQDLDPDRLPVPLVELLGVDVGEVVAAGVVAQDVEVFVRGPDAEVEEGLDVVAPEALEELPVGLGVADGDHLRAPHAPGDAGRRRGQELVPVEAGEHQLEQEAGLAAAEVFSGRPIGGRRPHRGGELRRDGREVRAQEGAPGGVVGEEPREPVEQRGPPAVLQRSVEHRDRGREPFARRRGQPGGEDLGRGPVAKDPVLLLETPGEDDALEEVDVEPREGEALLGRPAPRQRRGGRRVVLDQAARPQARDARAQGPARRQRRLVSERPREQGIAGRALEHGGEGVPGLLGHVLHALRAREGPELGRGGVAPEEGEARGRAQLPQDHEGVAEVREVERHLQREHLGDDDRRRELEGSSLQLGEQRPAGLLAEEPRDHQDPGSQVRVDRSAPAGPSAMRPGLPAVGGDAAGDELELELRELGVVAEGLRLLVREVEAVRLADGREPGVRRPGLPALLLERRVDGSLGAELDEGPRGHGLSPGEGRPG
jgi:hypothetical protein